MEGPWDVVVVGAGAAGLFCAARAGQRGLRVALVDHAPRLAEKIRISGGGRCNFTNWQADRPEYYLSEQPEFAATALRAYQPRQFVALLNRHRIGWHEKHRGQLFCDESSTAIIQMLRTECDRAQVHWLRPCAVQAVEAVSAGRSTQRFVVRTEQGPLATSAVVVATGGLSIPQIGATDWGYRVARQFGLRVVEPRPALVPLTLPASDWTPFAALAGLSVPVRMRVLGHGSAPEFAEDLLLTHRGLSGPAVLQISSYWQPGQAVSMDLSPTQPLADQLRALRDGARMQLGTALSGLLPKRLVQVWLQQWAGKEGVDWAERRLAELGNRTLQSLAQALHGWTLQPDGTEGFRKAEVTVGGVATQALDPATMQVRSVPGLYFVGEVVDVTGWLGGYNFQWAWASAWAAAESLARSVE